MKKKDKGLLLLLLLFGGAVALWPKGADAAEAEAPPHGFRLLTSDPQWKTTERGRFIKFLVDEGHAVYWDGADRFWLPGDWTKAKELMSDKRAPDVDFNQIFISSDEGTRIWTIL